MTEEQYNKSIETGELQLNFWQKVSHFSIVGFMSFISLVLLSFDLFDYLQGNPVSFARGEVFFIVIPIILGLLFYWLQKNRLKFKVIKTTLKKEDIIKLIELVCKGMEWTFSHSNSNIFTAKSHPGFFSGSWGEQITILINGHDVLVNSICDPDIRTSLVSMGRNRKNVQVLIDNFGENDAKAGLPSF